LDAPPGPADDVLPLLHAAASRTWPTVAMMAAAVRADRARRGRRMTRALSFIVPSSVPGSWLRLVAGGHRGRLLSASWAAPFEVVRGAAALQS
jgi:hypothetical protein